MMMLFDNKHMLYGIEFDKNNLCPKRWYSLEAKEISYTAEQQQLGEEGAVVFICCCM